MCLSLVAPAPCIARLRLGRKARLPRRVRLSYGGKARLPFSFEGLLGYLQPVAGLAELAQKIGDFPLRLKDLRPGAGKNVSRLWPRRRRAGGSCQFWQHSVPAPVRIDDAV